MNCDRIGVQKVRNEMITLKNILEKYDMMRNVGFFFLWDQNNNMHFVRENDQEKYMAQTWVQAYGKCKVETMDNTGNQRPSVWKYYEGDEKVFQM